MTVIAQYSLEHATMIEEMIIQNLPGKSFKRVFMSSIELNLERVLAKQLRLINRLILYSKEKALSYKVEFISTVELTSFLTSHCLHHLDTADDFMTTAFMESLLILTTYEYSPIKSTILG